MSSKTRVLLMGIDAGTFTVIEPLFRMNMLPALRDLLDLGVHGELISTIPPITAPAWTSLATGKNPGKHGIFDFVTRKPGSYEEKLTSSVDRKCEAIWNILTRYGRQVIVVNVPLTYPPDKVSGCMISGIGSPDKSERIAFPRSILEEVERSCGSYRVMYRNEPTDNNCEAFIADLKSLIRTRGVTVRFLMDRIDWDLLFIVFQSTDWVQHFYWRFMDETDPLFIPNATECQRNAIAEVYKAIDHEIGEIVQLTRESDYVFVVSDHGMGPLHKNVYFNNWLSMEGYIRYKRNLRYLAHRAGLSSENVYKLVMRVNASGIIPRFRSHKEGMIRLFLSMRDVDWERSKAYSIGLDGNIRINLKGREPQGIISSGEEYTRVISELKSKVESLSDPSTGKRVVDGVFSSSEIYSGPYTSDAPDLVLLLTRYHQDYTLVSNSIFGLPPNKYSGNHRISGVLFASGPGIKKGVKVGPHSLLDITPTILQVLDVPSPSDLDGSPMIDIYSEPPRKETRREQAPSHETAGTYTREEEEKLKERLRALGYL
jgi:predicted AlkP superfamily phosphohydrolase/phosphomutase